MNERSREVFRRLVETYLETGDPVGSRTLARTVSEGVSAATIRNVMQDLEHLGLLNSPHVSAGRIPTQLGLRLFVDGILEVGDVSGAERSEIERSLGGNEADLTTMLDRAGDMLSGLTHGASLVLVPKTAAPIRHIEFVSIAPDRALVVLVTADGQVENRLFTPPVGLTPSAMRAAANFLNAILQGRTLTEMRGVVSAEIARRRAELDELSRDLIEAGTALWADDPGGRDRLIVHGRAHLIEGTGDAAAAGAHPRALRRPRAQARSRPASRPHRGRRRGAGLHRIREQAFLTFGFLSGGVSLYECGPQDHRRGRCDRADAAELRPDRADRRLHGAAGRTVDL